MVMISGSNPLQAPGSGLLEEFERVASQDGANLIELDGEKLRVLGQGALPGSGRSVQWVDSSHADEPVSGVARVFTEALGERYGSGLAKGIARELGLDRLGSKPIESRTVQQALDMARTASSALEGHRFALQLGLDPRMNGPEFVSLLQDMGVDGSALTTQAREAVHHRFNQFLDQTGTGMDDAGIRAGLRAIIHDVLGTPADRR